MKPKILTELETVKLSLQMWKWLYKHPLCKKQDYPYFVKYGYINMHSHCPLCEIYENCRGCCLDDENINSCASGHFALWSTAVMCEDEEKSCDHAKYIVDKIQEKYNQLTKKK